MEPILAANIVILAALTGVNEIAYRLNQQIGFRYLAIGWSLNLAYLMIHNLVAPGEPGDTDQTLTALQQAVILVASMPSTVFFYMAAIAFWAIISPRGNMGRIMVPTIWGVGISLIIFACLPELGIVPSAYSYYAMSSPAAIFTFYVITRLALFFRAIRPPQLSAVLRRRDVAGNNEWTCDEPFGMVDIDRQDSSSSESATKDMSRGRILLIISFSMYGLLQLTYPIKHFIGDDEPLLFYLAVVLKCVNAGGMAIYLLGHVSQVAQIARTRGILVELGVLSASIEHDIRNPLSHMLMRMRIVGQRYSQDQFLVKEVSFLKRQLARIQAAADIVPAMRETKEYYEKRSLTWKLQDLAAISAKAVKKLYETTQPRIFIDFTSPALYVQGNGERLQQTFVNILNNGLEACMAKGAGTPLAIEIRFSRDSALGMAAIHIKDKGIGIAPDILSRITDPLFSTKDNRKANKGIGLFIAKRIIENHGGKLTFDSVKNEFTEVTVSLPAVGR